ncbi:MAG TPA: response regulator transcription factor [Acetobacteraceae bacterium]|nr:response regulator transcription factor [Acetobacteraceae bacterium]
MQLKESHPFSLVFLDPDTTFIDDMTEYLNSNGFSLTRAHCWDDLIRYVKEAAPAVVVMEQNVDYTDTIRLLPEIRRSFDGGILILTENQEASDRIMGLEMGADDFVLKTTPRRELLARIRAVLRRSRQVSPGTITEGKEQSWILDKSRRELINPQRQLVRLTSMEFDLLVYLDEHQNQLVSRQELAINILRRQYNPTDRSIDNMIGSLRRKLEGRGRDSRIIKSLRGQGYIFVGFRTPEPEQGSPDTPS